MIPEVGKRYLVQIEDCCVSGDFTATVTLCEWHEWGRMSRIVFDNGVRLTEVGQVGFTEVES